MATRQQQRDGSRARGRLNRIGRGLARKTIRRLAARQIAVNHELRNTIRILVSERVEALSTATWDLPARADRPRGVAGPDHCPSGGDGSRARRGHPGPGGRAGARRPARRGGRRAAVHGRRSVRPLRRARCGDRLRLPRRGRGAGDAPTGGSRTSSAGRRTASATASEATWRSSASVPQSSTRAAGEASSSTCSTRRASRPAASMPTPGWCSAASTRATTCERATSTTTSRASPTRHSGRSSRPRSSSTCPTTRCGASWTSGAEAGAARPPHRRDGQPARARRPQGVLGRPDAPAPGVPRGGAGARAHRRLPVGVRVPPDGQRRRLSATAWSRARTRSSPPLRREVLLPSSPRPRWRRRARWPTTCATTIRGRLRRALRGSRHVVGGRGIRPRQRRRACGRGRRARCAVPMARCRDRGAASASYAS